MNVFVEALEKGQSKAPFPADPRFTQAVSEIKRSTGDDGPLFVEAIRTIRFAEQPRCGRIAFIITQPSSRRAWPELGGQINLCKDGLPPWQICSDQPNTLIPPGKPCKNGTAPQNTKEVQSAIDDAIAEGGLSQQRIRPHQ